MATFDTAVDPVSKKVWCRLLIAGALSLLLHLMVLLGMPVKSGGGMRDGVTTLFAQLEPVPDGAPAESFAQGITAESAARVPEDAQTQWVATKAEPRPKPKPAFAPAPDPGAGIELPLSRDPTYYPAKQLDVYPLPLTPIKLDYPAAAANARVDGRLLVLLLVDEFGVVNEASVVEAEPQGYFEEAALAVFRAARFSPAQKQGKPVKSRALLQVNYVYGNSQAAVR